MLKEKMIQKPLIILACLIAGCSAAEEQHSSASVSMANPASVYCTDQGGKLEIVKTQTGESGYCTLPDGERVEEWALFRRDHQ